ncbi:hypothetical protein [Bradyrhizobium sp. SZCCHNRI1009]|uniref:hypothetical protein n=1 Tax=Bradyrhizobium sp. SZCCHNRI1009 TaxID=3057277 RepID=UPI002915FDDE|nr:hypothetical protein [Bradyrhizobium sp. SZCCHNRI1009]
MQTMLSSGSASEISFGGGATTTATRPPITSPAASSSVAASSTCAASSGLACIPGTNIIQPLSGTSSGNSYQPGFGGGGGSSPASDTTPPEISAVSVSSISSSTETIIWTANEPATSAVNYGLTTSYGLASSSLALSTSHSITLTGLTASSTYDFDVSSTDKAGNTAASNNQTFTTAAYNYYVDSVNGNDANPGTSPSLAFQNLTALPTINSGQSVGLAADSYWRQTLAIGTGSPLVNNVTVAMYGTGAKPVIDGVDAVNAGDWSKTGGFTNLYQATESLPGAGSWVNVFENGQFLQNVASHATADATACSYYISDMTLTSAPIYVHTCDGSNPGSNGKTYEYTRRSLVLQVWGNNETISNVSTKRAGSNNGSLVVQGDGSASYIQGCTADLGGKHNIFAPGGSTIDGCTFTDEYYPSFGSMAVFFDGVGSGLPVVLKNSTFTQTQNITGNNVGVFTAHTGSGSLGTITVATSTLIATNGAKLTGITAQNAPSLLVTNVIASSTTALVSPSVNTTINNSQLVSS